MRKEFLVFGNPLLGAAEEHEVLDSMRQAWLGTGPKVQQFEKLFSAYKSIPSAAKLNDEDATDVVEAISDTLSV